MEKIYFSKDIQKLLEVCDFKRLGSDVAMKVHFGEKGCTTYVSPRLIKLFYDKVIELKKSAVLVECNVLYRGSRTNSKDHIETAIHHGFDFAPIDILDGQRGSEYFSQPIDFGMLKEARLGKGLLKYDSMIVISHFKGHEMVGYGGALKNIGMGLGSRSGKLAMHSDVEPIVNMAKCVGCGICVENCDFGAISLVSGKAVIDPKKCKGCAMCIAVCPKKAITVPWRGSTSKQLAQKIVEYAGAVIERIGAEKIIYINVLENITPLCDCVGIAQKKLIPDIGFLLGYDPVAIDKASLDLANKYAEFNIVSRQDKSMQVDYGNEVGIGSLEYELINL